MPFGCFSFSQTVFAQTLEVKSKNIVFVGDVSETEGRELVKTLEIYRSTILALTNTKNKPDRVPLKVYGFRNAKNLQKFTNLRGIAGIYKSGIDGPLFATITDKGSLDPKDFNTQVAFHEYSHHVLHGLSRDNYPRWYDEGFANYLSTFQVKDGVITIGLPYVQHAKWLKTARWMKAKNVFSAIDYYPRHGSLTMFYAQSWLYVH